ncbi:MAG TPA: (2Fe-2S)-binding protein [Rhizomicrobium sp.]
MKSELSLNMTRRTLLGSSVLAPLAPAASGAPPSRDDAMDIMLEVNGKRRNLVLDSRTTLLDALRENLDLTGSKKGCDHGQCGACTVLVGGRRILSCLTLAASVRAPVTTIEGLAGDDGTLHPMQQAFLDQDAFQCGYCTPGQILSAVACIREGHAGSDGEIREYMSGNLCRCAAYPHIVAAVKQAKALMEKG